MTEDPIQVEVAPERTPWFLPVAVLAMALLLIAITLSEDSVAPIDVADDPGPIAPFQADSASEPGTTGPEEPTVVSPERVSLGQMVPEFDGTLHVWVRDGDDHRLLIWPHQLATPRPMDLPAGTVAVDLNSERLKTLVVTSSQTGRHVLWLGDRSNVEPVMIYDDPTNAVWHASSPDRLTVSIAAQDATVVVTFRVEPGNLLVELNRFELEAGRTVEWMSDEGIALASRSGLQVGVWLTYDGQSTTYSRHLTQPGGRPIFDICTGVPCRPTVRMYSAGDGQFAVVDPEVVQVTPDEAWEMVSTANGAGIRRVGSDTVLRVPISGLNAWSHDSRWMVYEAEALLVELPDASEVGSRIVTHPLGFVDTAGLEVSTVPHPGTGEIEGIWLP